MNLAHLEKPPWEGIEYNWSGRLLTGDIIDWTKATIPSERWIRFLATLGLHLHPAQQEAFSIRNRVKYYLCGRRWGKTVAGIAEILRHAIEIPKARILYLAAHHDQLDEGLSYLRMLTETLHELYHIPILDRASSTRAPKFQIADSTIYPSVFLREGKLRGRGYTMVLIDEAELLEQHIFEYAIAPALGERQGELIFLSTPRGNSWLLDFVKTQSGALLNYPTWTNPMFPRTELEKAWRTWNRTAFRQEYGAEVLTLVGRFFETEPVIVPCLPHTRLIHAVGLDWGYDAPFAALWVAKDPQGNYYAYNEIYQRGLTEIAQARMVLAAGIQHVSQIVADPTAFRMSPTSIAQAWFEHGLPYIQEGTRDRISTLALLRALLAEGKLKIVHNTCPNLLRELQEAQIHPTRAEELIGDDHAIDALRYAISALHPLSVHTPSHPPENTWAWYEWNANQLKRMRELETLKW